MFTTQKLLTSAALLTAIFILPSTVAFGVANWPETFKGQPDFDFNRDTINEEWKKREKELGFPPYMATWADLFESKGVDPFTPRPRFQRMKDGSFGDTNPFAPDGLIIEDAPNTNTDEPIAPSNATLQTGITYDNSAPDLGILGNNKHSELDLSEFESFLGKLIYNHLSQADKALEKMDFSTKLARLKLQSVVTQPHTYATINGRRYSIGDRFIIPIKVTFDRQEAEKLIESNMPEISNMPADIQLQYKEIKQKALKLYDDKVKALTTGSSAKVHKINVTVKNIRHRTVIVSILGKQYKMQMPLSL